MQDMQEGVYPSFASQSVAVKYRSEPYCWTQKLNREDYGVDRYWSFFFFSLLRFEMGG
jgi:hypothetical protein